MVSAVALTVKAVIASELGLALDEVQDNTPLVTLGMDSLEMVSLIQELEEALHCEIPDDDLPKLNTPLAIARYIEARG